MRSLFIFGLTVFAALATALRPERAGALVIASDNSGDAAYNSGWNTGTNGGSGFAAWTLQNTANAGFFQFTATDNDNGGSSSANINAGGDSFGQFANSGGRSVGYRAFNLTTGDTALQPTHTFNWSMDNGGVDDLGASVGVSLRTGNANGDANDGTIFSGRRFGFEFQQGNSDYKIIDSTGTRNTGIGFRRTGLNLSLFLTSADSYSLTVTDVNSGSALGTFTGNFSGTLGAAINSFSVYNRFAGGGAERNLFTNNFLVTAVPETSPMILVASVLAAIYLGGVTSQRFASARAARMA